MTDVYRRMKKDENDDSPAKCRDRRRRRIEMRRLAAVAGDASLPPSNHSRVDNNHLQTSDCVPEAKRVRSAEMKDFPTPPSSASSSDAAEAAPPEATAPATLAEPVFGTMSLSGRSREMEDAVAVRMRLCLPEICRWQPVHFFAVYDGHGGSHVAELCRERMHVYVEEELMRVCDKQGSETCGGGSSSEEEEWWRTALKRCFNRMDETALNTCPCGSAGYQCGCHPMEAALAGSTAVVAILTPEDIIVANCGDSRAVLSRGGRAVPLSSDHKPDRSDELARIKSAGGRVIFVNGARVEGILAMSRAIGRYYA
ncbi:probable protein phosphatase 2C 75 isoform X2 [Malania oleifera]|uniref:probable protein phosphatase 2C 75 isoform X2 n=1 Tax=Malania oleifera TaxID=397392 RepID=UPI0025AEA793|nr:probable protein phosphatase 2C 75 isoform X2 [Malania oleifera]